MADSILATGQKYITEHFTDVPPDKKAAAVAMVDLNGAEFGFATRVGEHWILTAEAEKKWADKGVGAKLVVLGTW